MGFCVGIMGIRQAVKAQDFDSCITLVRIQHAQFNLEYMSVVRSAFDGLCMLQLIVGLNGKV